MRWSQLPIWLAALIGAAVLTASSALLVSALSAPTGAAALLTATAQMLVSTHASMHATGIAQPASICRHCTEVPLPTSTAVPVAATTTPTLPSLSPQPTASRRPPTLSPTRAPALRPTASATRTPRATPPPLTPTPTLTRTPRPTRVPPAIPLMPQVRTQLWMLAVHERTAFLEVSHTQSLYLWSLQRRGVSVVGELSATGGAPLRTLQLADLAPDDLGMDTTP